jgi:DNA ligase (NAD+)
LARLLNALSIRHVGARGASILAEHFASMDELQEATVEQLAEIHEIGEITARSVYGFLHSEHGQRAIDDLRAVGVAMESVRRDAAAAGTQPLAGKTFVVTGTLSRYTRDEIQALIEQYGGRAASSVSKKTHYVVAGENAGSKLDKARELQIPVLSEDDFERLIANA